MNVSQLLNRKRLLVFTIVIIAIALLYGTSPPSEVEIEEIDNVTYSVDHSFTAEATNLLRANSTTDKLESRLNKYDIKFAIDEVFLSEGLAINSDVIINLGGVNIPVSTFDPKTNIGYLLIDYDRLGGRIIRRKVRESKNIKTV